MKKNNSLIISIFLILFSLIPLIWFLGKPGTVINGLDTNYPLNPNVWLNKRFYIWDSTNNGGGDISSSSSGIFFHFLQTFFYNLGFNLQITQISTLIFWFGSIVLSSYLFSSVFLNKWQSRITFVILYALNIYLFNTWENVKVSNLSLVVSIPFSLFILDRLLSKNKKFVEVWYLIVILFFFQMGTGINPAYFLTFLFSNFIFVMFNFSKQTFYKKLFVFFKYLVIICILNIFWILPLVNFLFFVGKVNTVEEYGLINWLDFLSQNTSYLNVIRGQGLWDWYALDDGGYPLYIPYALNYFYNLPFIVFSFITPIFALLSLILRPKNNNSKYYLFFLTLLVVSLFFGVGGHEPTGFIYKFLVNNLPMFNFFRSPWYIFTPLMLISLFGLAALFLDQIVIEYKKNIEINQLIYFLLGIFIFGHFLYSYPLITGKIFRPGKQDTFYVNYPDYVFESVSYLNNQNKIARIFSYPKSTLEEFTWKYRGVESLLSLGTDIEIINNHSNRGNNLDKFRDRVYQYFQLDKSELALKIFPFIGVDSFWNKNDAYPYSQQIFFDNEVVKKSIGEWDFYNFTQSKKIFSPKYLYVVDTSDSMIDLSLYSKKDSVFVFNKDSVIARLPINLTKANLLEKNNINYNLVEYKVNSTFDNKNIFIISENLNFDQIKIDSKLSSSATPILGGVVFKNSQISNTTFKITYPFTENIFSYNDVLEAREDLDAFPYIIESKNNTIPFYYSGKNVYFQTIPVSNFVPHQKYQISFLYKTISGNAPIFDVYQYIGNSAVNASPIYLENSLEWKEIEFLFDPIKTNSNLRFSLRLPANELFLNNYTEFKDIKITPIYENNAYEIETEKENFAPQVMFEKISPVKYKIYSSTKDGGYVLAFLENYSKGWILKSKNKERIKDHFMINGYANAWYIPGDIKTNEFEIYYQPQNVYYLGLVISSIFFSGFLIYNLYKWKK